jgi:phosphopantetheinyl transferase
VKPANFKPYCLPLGELPMPPPGMVHLWFLDLAELGNPLHQGTGAAAGLLLGAYLGLPGKDVHISRRVKGKPILSGNGGNRGLDFSISNSDGCCLIGVCSAGMLGVDMERSGRQTGDPKGLARRYFSVRESEVIDALGPAEADRVFLRTWACKEALVKGAGHGIANQLCRFTVTCDAEPRVLDMQDDDPGAWKLVMVQPSERHIGAVAFRHPEIRLEAFRLERNP